MGTQLAPPPQKKGAQSPNFRPMFVVAKRSAVSAILLSTFYSFSIALILFGSVRQIKLAVCQLLNARKCSVSFRIVGSVSLRKTRFAVTLGDLRGIFLLHVFFSYDFLYSSLQDFIRQNKGNKDGLLRWTDPWDPMSPAGFEIWLVRLPKVSKNVSNSASRRPLVISELLVEISECCKRVSQPTPTGHLPFTFQLTFCVRVYIDRGCRLALCLLSHAYLRCRPRGAVYVPERAEL